MRRGIQAPPQTRFDRLYIPEPNSGCWLWLGSVDRKMGYGDFMLTSPRTIRAHRASYILHRGPIPDGLKVLHRCDQPSCVNPDHLWLGTDQDNTDDAMRKGRRPQSLKRPKRVDRAAIVAAVERTIGTLARRYRISPEQTREIASL